MFASRIAEAEPKSAKCSRRKTATTNPPALERHLGGDAVSLMRCLQRTIGNQATLRLLRRKTGNSTTNRATESLASGPSWIFASGLYSPKDGAGRRLLAHELAHVRQQAETTASKPDRLQRAPDKEKPKAEESDCTPSPETYDKVRSFDKDNIALGLTHPHIEFSWKPQFTKGTCSVKLSKAKLSFKPFVFTKEGTYVFGPAVDKSGTCKGKLDHILKITGPMAERIEQGEREHCEDVRLAFSLSYEKYNKACEDLGVGFPAANAKECSAQVSARLKDAVGIDPSQWTKVADCLVNKTMERDSKEKGWHLARLEGSFDKDCKHFTSTPDPNRSLPEVGKHPSSALVKGCGE